MFPGRRAQRASGLLRLLGSRVPPRVWAAVWRTLWNGWATNRRMQGQGAVRRCIYGCSADDSIEHYAFCPVIAATVGPELGLGRPGTAPAALLDFLALEPPATRINGAVLVKKAVRMAAAYRTHILVTHGAVRPGAAAREALFQSLREVVRGHAGASQAGFLHA